MGYVKNEMIFVTEAKDFNLSLRYIGDTLSINNPTFVNWHPLI